ncbi:MAG TPA: trypsin-like peptidase domain-containing protein [Thermoanaerobaculia bacterium]|nr:trypsin-like peptidase domain-containing protein [Thermoanaerobaculia bacterium]
MLIDEQFRRRFASSFIRIYKTKGYETLGGEEDVKTADLAVEGAGFLIKKDCIVTCLHVVEGALGLPGDQARGREILLDFPLLSGMSSEAQQNGSSIRASVTDCEKDLDVAWLKPLLPLPEGSYPASNFARRGYSLGQSCSVCGFPAPYSRESVEPFRKGVWARGQIAGFQEGGRVQIDVSSGTYKISAGFSGGPVWDEEGRAIIGMIVTADRKDDARAAFFIPVEKLTPPSPEPLARAARPVATESPYPGPQPFPPEKVGYFFGREDEAEKLCEKIDKNHCVLVYAPSGAGKSSLLDTRVRQLLEEVGFQVLRKARVNYLPAEEIPEGCNIYVRSVLSFLEEDTNEAAYCTAATGFVEYLESHPLPERFVSRVLIIDQLEEILGPSLKGHEEDANNFFVELQHALVRAGDSLHVVLSFRQEVLAPIESAWDPSRRQEEGCIWDSFYLQKLDLAGARSAIEGPAEREGVRFAGHVVDCLVNELSKRAVRLRQGKIDYSPGDFVEPVALQIVCGRLWTSFDKQAEKLTALDVKKAAMEISGGGRPGTTLEEDMSLLVRGALQNFFDETVKRTAEKHNVQEKLLRVHCLQFVTQEGARLPVCRGENRTGRILNSIVDTLEGSHLLRAEERGGDTWYELAHDTLIKPILDQQKKEPGLAQLVKAVELLQSAVRTAEGENGKDLKGFFADRDGLLASVEEYGSGLYPEEVGFVLRCCLATGTKLSFWTRRLRELQEQGGQETLGELLSGVLEDALENPDALVRENAVRLVGERSLVPGDGPQRLKDLERRLPGIALKDEDERVRGTAARSLALLDQEDLYESLSRSATAEKRRPFLHALGEIAHRTSLDQGTAFQAFWKNLSSWTRLAVRWQVAKLRLSFGASQLILIPLLSAVSTPLLTMVARGPLSEFGFSQTLASKEGGFGQGVFHSIVGGASWGFMIPFFVILYWLLFERTPDSVRRRFLPASLAGALGGVVGGIINTFCVFGVYERMSLAKAGWIGGMAKKSLGSLFWETRFGFFFPVTGFFLGAALGIVLVLLRSRPEWRDFLSRQQSEGPLRELPRAGGVLWKVSKISLRGLWILILGISLGETVVAFLVLRPGTEVLKEFSGQAMMAAKSYGDGASLVTGAFGLSVGTLFGLLLHRVGFGISFGLEDDESKEGE